MRRAAGICNEKRHWCSPTVCFFFLLHSQQVGVPLKSLTSTFSSDEENLPRDDRDDCAKFSVVVFFWALKSSGVFKALS